MENDVRDTQVIGDQRTIKQNNASYKWFELYSSALNEAGYDMKRTLKADFSIQWTPDSFKRNVVHPVILAMFGKSSTKDLTTKEISQAADVIISHLGTKTGVSIPFPSKEDK